MCVGGGGGQGGYNMKKNPGFGYARKKNGSKGDLKKITLPKKIVIDNNLALPQNLVKI